METTSRQNNKPPPVIKRSKHGIATMQRWLKNQGNLGSKFRKHIMGKRDNKPHESKEDPKEGDSSWTTERRTKIDTRERQEENAGNAETLATTLHFKPMDPTL